MKPALPKAHDRMRGVVIFGGECSIIYGGFRLHRRFHGCALALASVHS